MGSHSATINSLTNTVVPNEHNGSGFSTQVRKGTSVKLPAAKTKTEDVGEQKLNAVEGDDDDDLPLSSLMSAAGASKAKPALQTVQAHREGTERKIGNSVQSSQQPVSESEDDCPLSDLVSCSTKRRRQPLLSDADDDLPLSSLTSKAKKKVKGTKKRPREANSQATDSDSDDTPLANLKLPAKKRAKKDGKPAKSESKRNRVIATKKRPATTSKGRATKESKKKRSGASNSKNSQPTKKQKGEEEHLWDWWEAKPLPEGVKWLELRHNGVLFAPAYQPHGVKMLYDGRPVTLSPQSEEVATYFSQYLESTHIEKPQFSKNFFREFTKKLNKYDKGHTIKEFSKCDFRPIHKHILKVREQRKNRSKEEKEREKEEKKKEIEKYGWAIVDGHKERIANFRVEPPGLFLGRGDHPKAGVLKQRIRPKDVTLNLSKDAPVPECPIEGEKWGAIVHDSSVSWLAYWKDPITNSFKYVYLGEGSRVKGEADKKKYEKARELKKHIHRIRKDYTKGLRSSNVTESQRATALWMIDVLALRVGNEKGEDEADTVGVCSLRAEHVTLEPILEDKIYKITLDFLGKDSMRYYNTVEVPKGVYLNLAKFKHKKKPSDQLFDKLTTSSLNSYLKGYMEGLTAKVFRTYNASITLEQELAKQDLSKTKLMDEKVLAYNRANLQVAVLCNHQRSLPKTFNQQMERLDDKIEGIDENIKQLRAQLKRLKANKALKETYTAKKGIMGVKEDLLPKKVKLQNNKESIDKAIKRLKERRKKWQIKKTEKDDLKTVALGTSKKNYMDPRITVAWAKREGVNIEKLFAKQLREKFRWSFYVPPDFKF